MEGAIKVSKLRKVSPATRSPNRDQIQVVDKSEPVAKIKVKSKKRTKEEFSEDHLQNKQMLEMQKRFINTDSSKLFANDGNNNRSSVLSNIPHKILKLKNKGTNKRQREALRNFMARYGRYEQSPKPLNTDRLPMNDKSALS